MPYLVALLIGLALIAAFPVVTLILPRLFLGAPIMAGRLLGAVIAALLIAAVVIISPKIAAGGLLYPSRHAVRAAIPPGCENRDFQGDDVTLRGWHCGAIGKRRATIVYLHGVADNRGSSVGVIQRFVPRGFDVVAPTAAGTASRLATFTYGFVEKRDLRRVIDGLPRVRSS